MNFQNFRNRRAAGAALLGGVLGLAALMAATQIRRGPVAQDRAVQTPQPEMLSQIEALRQDLSGLKAERARDAHVIQQLGLAMQRQEELSSARISTSVQPMRKRPRKNPSTPSRSNEIQQAANEAKELRQYLEDIRRSAGILDEAMSKDQWLQQRAAELRKAAGNP